MIAAKLPGFVTGQPGRMAVLTAYSHSPNPQPAIVASTLSVESCPTDYLFMICLTRELEPKRDRWILRYICTCWGLGTHPPTSTRIA